MGRIDHNFSSANRLFVHDLLEQAPRGSLQLGAGRGQRDQRRRHQRLPGHAGVRLPQQHRRDRRLHLGAVVRACCSTCAPAGRASANRAIRRRTSIRRSSASRRRRSRADERLSVPAALHVRQLQHDQRELDDRVARLAALGLEQRLQPSDGHAVGHADADQDLGRAHRARSATTAAGSSWNIINDGYPGRALPFNGAYTRASNSAATNDRAQSWAQFLLGLPTAATGAVATPGRPRPASSRSPRRESSARCITACSCRTTGASTRS